MLSLTNFKSRFPRLGTGGKLTSGYLRERDSLSVSNMGSL